jgi:phosphohistidine phosphatase SixA
VKAKSTDVWLVRHACAGHRDDWGAAADEERPLDLAGKAQARALSRLLVDANPLRLVASPTRRCVETLLPLSMKVGLDTETSPLLRNDAPRGLDDVVHRRFAGGAVFCTHGEALQSFLLRLRKEGLRVDHDRTDDELLMKGAAWRLRLDGPKGPRVRLMVPLGVQSCPHHPYG